MKRYTLLSIFAVFSLGALWYLYSNSGSQLNASHGEVLRWIAAAKQADASLEKDLLKARNFLSMNYDAVVDRVEDVEDVCVNFLHSGGNEDLGHQLEVQTHKYCKAIDQKLQLVENFKSKNAIYRNSIYFIQKIEVESSNLVSAGARMDIMRKLTEQSLAYSVLSTKEAKAVLAASIENAQNYFKKHPTDSELGMVVSHSQKILNVKEELDALTEKIVNSSSEEILEEIRTQYLRDYSIAENKAATNRILLLILCTVLLLVVIKSLMLLIRYARKLADLNATLERRVVERTHDLQKSQETIVQQQQALIGSAKMTALGEMAGGVAHEINTPLAIISMRVEQLEESIAEQHIDVVDFLEGITTIRKTTERISKIVNGLRFFAREGKKSGMVKTKVSTLIEDTLSFCAERFRAHGVTLEVTKTPFYQNAEIDCREVEISQVLLNLLNNAYDATEGHPKRWVRVEAVDRNEYTEITVTDSGHGIPQAVADKLMQPFFTTKGVGKGTGLGLSISKGLIEGHLGKLYLDRNSPNTCFVMMLPKFQEGAQTSRLIEDDEVA